MVRKEGKGKESLVCMVGYKEHKKESPLGTRTQSVTKMK